MRIIVMGYIIRGPLGGMCFHYLQYLIGLKNLGHKVFYIEDSDNYPSCYDPLKFETSTDPSYGLNFIKDLFAKYGLHNDWAYYDEHRNQWHGQSFNDVERICKTADMLINISNVAAYRDWWAKIPLRILIDTDPAFTQIRHIEEKQAGDIAKVHTHHFSFGENFGKPDCRIPDDGLDWKPTRQPVVMDLWSNTTQRPNSRWTTVMQWDSYKSKTYNGQVYGMKSKSFEKYISVPSIRNEQFELALGGESAPRDLLTTNGWQLSDPLTVALSAADFKSYIDESKGEFSIAKHGYVISNSGWFSERTANYLAS